MRADFYLIAKPRFAQQPLLLVCELARMAAVGSGGNQGNGDATVGQDAREPPRALPRPLSRACTYVPARSISHWLSRPTGRPVAMPRLPSSDAEPAMSRCAQRWPSVKRDRKQPAVMAPAQRPPML